MDYTTGLPTSYPDLGVMFQHLPMVAAAQAGTQQQLADQNNQSLRDAFQTEQDYLGQKRPLDLAHQMLLNQGHSLENQQAQQKVDFNQQTQPGTIAATNAKNKTAVNENDLAQQEQFGQQMGNLAARLATAPPMMRPQMAKQALAPYVQDHPELDNLLVQNADQLPQYFKDMSDNYYQMTNKAREAALREQRETERERIRQQGQLDIANANINAGRWAPKGRQVTEQELVSKMGFEKAAVYYDAKAESAREQGNEQAATYYSAQADKMKTAYERAKTLAAGAAQAGKVDVGATAGVPTNPAPVPQGFSQPAPEGRVPVIAPDGRRGFLKADQLEEALKHGYKRAQ